VTEADLEPVVAQLAERKAEPPPDGSFFGLPIK
jgi:hypothetical protein